jgi:L-ascorbate metabolism protein UlaG (beta-lactamase superfamily)
LAVSISLAATDASLAAVLSGNPPSGCFSLWQLPSQTENIMNSYVIQSPNGRVMVMDGGYKADAPYLKSFLNNLGGHVDAWFISHQHDDHVEALTAILQDPGTIQIDRIYGSLVSDTFLASHPQAAMLDTAQALNAAMAARGKSAIQPNLGQTIAIDGLNFQILTLADPDHWTGNSNDFSMVVRLSTPDTSVLFLGDLGVDGGQRLLASSLADKLPSEYVQMAHHGQAGVGRAVYEAIDPKYALWPTPSGIWNWQTTLEVRSWMNNLGVEKNYVMWQDGLVRLDLPAAPEPGTAVLLCTGGIAGHLFYRWRHCHRAKRLGHDTVTSVRLSEPVSK